MAGQPSGNSEGVVTVRHPRAYDGIQDAWIEQVAEAIYAQLYPVELQELNSYRATDRLIAIRNRIFLTDFPQQGWLRTVTVEAPRFTVPEAQLSNSFCPPKRNILPNKYYGTPFGRQSSITDPRNTNAAWAQLTNSERARPSLWSKYPVWRVPNAFDASPLLPTIPQKPWVSSQWPSIPIRDERVRNRNQQVRITTLTDGYITANLVAPSFDAKWLVAIDQLANSHRQQYVQQLTLSPGLGRQNVDGGYITPPPAFDATTFPWTIDSRFMSRGAQWPQQTVQKTSFALLDPAQVLAVMSSQSASFGLRTGLGWNDPRFRQVDWNIAQWVSLVANTTFDPVRMSSNFDLAADRMATRKWWTSDPMPLAWLIPPVLYDPIFFNPIPAQGLSFRSPAILRNRQPWTYDPDNGWLVNATPAFDPTGMAWAIHAAFPNKRTNVRDDRQRTYDPDNAWNVFHPELIDWTHHDVLNLRTNFRDDRQRTYHPDSAWNIYHPETINWSNQDVRMANIHAKIQYQQPLSEYEIAWITANVPAIDPTIWIAVVQQLNSERARGVYRDVRQLTEMVQISWLFDVLHLTDLPNIPPVEPTVDQDPHFTTSPTITPYWLVYPRRTRHRRHH